MGILSLMNGILFKVLQYALKLRIMVDDRSGVYDLEALVIAMYDYKLCYHQFVSASTQFDIAMSQSL